MAYLDHAATTALRPEARAAMLPWLGEQFGNPSGSHAVARAARQAVDEARDVMAEVLGCRPSEIVFTGGGTEADNTAVFGVHRARGGSVVCSAIEHHAVLEPVEVVGGRTVGVDARGVLDLDALTAVLSDTDDVMLVAVMAANNEVGTVQPVAEAAAVARRRAPGALVDTDAVQAFPWCDLTEVTPHVDLLSLSAHKFGGPQGVGVLVVRDGVELAPLLLGGGQERERRSGTHNVAGIVGMAAAAKATHDERKTTVDRIGELRDRLVDGLLDEVPDLFETGVGDRDRSHKVAGSCHVCIEGIESESLLFLLERADVFASAASSCASGAMEPSHVLAAMGVPHERATGSLRLSLGATSTAADVDRVLDVLPAAVARLRQFAS